MTSSLRRTGLSRALFLGVAALVVSAPAQAVEAPAPRLQSLEAAVASVTDDAAVSDSAAATDATPATIETKLEAVQQAFDEIGTGRASYYGRELEGNRTASGERFHAAALTAAHRTLPLGTKLRVTNLANGRSVIVRVNDRGPFIRGRLLDVSLAAAREIGMVASGSADVRLEVVRPTT
ncbi:MAG: septal ring lytic transglycosylase RlpA family protein [Allosphingosinicella sp.]